MIRRLARLLPERVRSVLRFVRYPERYAYFGPPFTYCKDGLATIHRADFRHDPKFRSAYDPSHRAGGWAGSWGNADPEWRMYLACWAAAHAARLGGDLAECGVYRGGLSRTVMEYIDFRSMTDRRYWLLDTFEGIPPAQLDSTVIHRHQYPDTFGEVTAVFGSYPNARIVRGCVPDTLAQVTADRLCFVSIDMNVTAPEIAAAEWCWPKLVSGGVILIDDYGWHGHEAQKSAFDDFAKRHGRDVLALPTGQGLLIK
jgi:O-methyltransferase